MNRMPNRAMTSFIGSEACTAVVSVCLGPRRARLAAWIAAGVLGALSVPAGAQQSMPPAGHTGNCASCHGGRDEHRYAFDPRLSRVTFEVDGYGLTRMSGIGAEIGGGFVFDPADPAASAVLATMAVTSLDMHDPLLNAVLASERLLDSAAHPTITFRSDEVAPAGDGRLRVTGMLTLRGVTREVTLDVTVNGHGRHPLTGDEVAGFSATTVLDRSDFGMGLGAPAVGERVGVRIEVLGTRIR